MNNILKSDIQFLAKSNPPLYRAMDKIGVTINELLKEFGEFELTVSNTLPATPPTTPPTPIDSTCIQRLSNVRYAACFSGVTAIDKIQAAHDDLPDTGGVIIANFEGFQDCGSSKLTISKKTYLFFGSATFGWTGGTSELILVCAESAAIIGFGGTTFMPISPVGATVDVIRVDGGARAVPGQVVQLVLRDFFIVAPITTYPARHGIHLDCTTQPIYRLNIDHVGVEGVGGRGVYLTNPTPIADGFAISTIHDSAFEKGIKLNRCGDTIRIKDNYLFGSDIGVDVDFVQGASTCIIEGNNISNIGGAVHLGAWAVSVRIINNEIEYVAAGGGSNSAAIDIDGNVASPSWHTVVEGNSIQILGFAGANINGVRVNYANDSVIEGNFFERGAGVTDIIVTANGIDTYIGVNRYDTKILASILSNSGLRTRHFNLQLLEVVVGIGTFTALAPLHVVGGISNAIALVSNTTNGVRIGASATTGFVEGVDETGFGSFEPLHIGGSTVTLGVFGVPKVVLDASGDLTTHHIFNATNITYDLGASATRWRKLWVKDIDLSGTLTGFTGITGSGTTGTVPKFTAAGAIGDSSIIEGASSVGFYGTAVVISNAGLLTASTITSTTIQISGTNVIDSSRNLVNIAAATLTGVIQAGGYKSSDGTVGATGTNAISGSIYKNGLCTTV